MKNHPVHPPIEDQLRMLPASPGVYIMKGRGGEVLYVGKARNLRARVRSYFRGTGDGRYAVRFLASRTALIDYIVTDTEKEALLLEDTLLKKFRPRYNIRLKDSKTYVSIKITVAERFPRILVTREVKRDGSRYFGPYVSARQVREMVKAIRRAFPLCVRPSARVRMSDRPCLDYQLGLCSAPLAGLISDEDYAEIVRGAVLFLSGRNREVLRGLRQEMNRASEALEFERAAALRDRIRAIESMLEDQKVVSHAGGDRGRAGPARARRKARQQPRLCLQGQGASRERDLVQLPHPVLQGRQGRAPRGPRGDHARGRPAPRGLARRKGRQKGQDKGPQEGRETEAPRDGRGERRGVAPEAPCGR